MIKMRFWMAKWRWQSQGLDLDFCYPSQYSFFHCEERLYRKSFWVGWGLSSPEWRLTTCESLFSLPYFLAVFSKEPSLLRAPVLPLGRRRKGWLRRLHTSAVRWRRPCRCFKKRRRRPSVWGHCRWGEGDPGTQTELGGDIRITGEGP